MPPKTSGSFDGRFVAMGGSATGATAGVGACGGSSADRTD